MNLEGISEAIITRLKTDTTAGGIWETSGTYKLVSITDTFAPDAAKSEGDLNAMYPYAVVDVRLDAIESGYQQELMDYSVDIDVYDARDGGHSAFHGKRICQRIIGNGKRTPDYGLSRHLLVTTNTQDDTGNPVVCDRLSLRSIVPKHERDAFSWTIGFDLRATRALAGV